MEHTAFDDKEKLTILEYTEQEILAIKHYVELTRHLQEIQQVFHITVYNLRVLLNTFELANNNTVRKIRSITDEFDEKTEINALVINFISSGKTLADTLIVCSESFAQSDSEGTLSHNQYQSTIYDGCFSYQLLTHLRNFSQHGHIPVSQDGDIFGFDVGGILRTPHYNQNARVKKQLERLYDEVVTVHQVEPYHTFTRGLAEYTTSLAQIYHHFWTLAIPELKRVYSLFLDIVQSHPGCEHHKDSKYNGYLVYRVEENLHAVEIGNRIDSYEVMRKEADGFLEEQERELEYLIESLRFVPLDELDVK